MKTTIDLMSRLTWGGTPMAYIVVVSVWIIRAPIIDPERKNFPPFSEVPPRTTARIASN